jgi:hypothetical protein
MPRKSAMPVISIPSRAPATGEDTSKAIEI